MQSKKLICLFLIFHVCLLVACSTAPIESEGGACELDAGAADAADESPIQGETCFGWPNYSGDGQPCVTETDCPPVLNPCETPLCNGWNRCTAADRGDGWPCPNGMWCVQRSCCPTAPKCITQLTDAGALDNCYSGTPCAPPRGCVDNQCCLP